MIEEYISQLQEENRKKLNSYDKEMQELSQELSVNEKLLSKLEKEKQDDKNIFSPRAQDSGTDLEIQKTQDEILLLKQRLESVSRMVETEVRNQDEYRKLAEEAAKEAANIENAEKKAAGKDDKEQRASQREDPKKDNSEKRADEKEGSEREPSKSIASGSGQTKGQAKSEMVSQNKTFGNQDLIDFLNSICKKVNFSVSLINGNKNRCRSELKNIERMIRSYEDGLRETENS